MILGHCQENPQDPPRFLEILTEIRALYESRTFSKKNTRDSVWISGHFQRDSRTFSDAWAPLKTIVEPSVILGHSQRGPP